jgi:hypothetical protein
MGKNESPSRCEPLKFTKERLSWSTIQADAVLRLPEPSPLAKQLLGSLQVNLPPVLPRSKVVVNTKRKLPTRRKNAEFLPLIGHSLVFGQGNFCFKPPALPEA